MRDIEEIRAELRAAEAAIKAELDALRESVKPEYKFTLLPAERRHQEVYDATCSVYELEGTLMNADALRAVGAHVPSTGGMAYLFNAGTGKLVTALGGGTIYVARAWSKDDGSDRIAFDELSRFLVEHPEGGDVTAIVEAHRNRRGRVM